MNQSVTPPGEPERWLPVVGWEDLYEVSDLGRVRRVLRWPERSAKRGRKGTVLSLSFHHGHLIVSLNRNCKSKSFRVHTLVAAAFLGPCPEGMIILHGAAGRLDNRPANLSYGTHLQNAGPDRYRDGTMPLGVLNASAKLNDDSVREIRARWAAGETKKSLAREFGVTEGAVRHLISRATWKHVA